VPLWQSGPTYFSEIISTANSIASQPMSAKHQHYSILLILTDGLITDMQKTIDTIVAASDKPLSIIIVGVGGTVSELNDNITHNHGSIAQW
jgi:vacuolar-type H+-ATPase subunit F/Vma7